MEPEAPQQLTLEPTSPKSSQLATQNGIVTTFIYTNCTVIRTSLLLIDLVTEDDIIYQDIMKDGGQKARALYDYQAGKSFGTLFF